MERRVKVAASANNSDPRCPGGDDARARIDDDEGDHPARDGGQDGDAAQAAGRRRTRETEGHVFRDGIEPGKPVIGVNLDETRPTTTTWPVSSSFHTSNRCPSRRPRITDAGLAHIETLTSLTELSLDNTGISDAGIAHLKGLVNLRKLTLVHTKVTGDGLVHLKDLKNLKTLSLMTTDVTDDGLVNLKGLSKLEWLFLDSTGITDAGLVHLGRLKQSRVPPAEQHGRDRCRIERPGTTDRTGDGLAAQDPRDRCRCGTAPEALPKAKIYH